MPVMSAGIRSGVNWIRLKVQSMTSADRADEHRLAQARDALEQDVAVREQPDQGVADELALADDDLADLGLDGAGALGERLRRDAMRLGGGRGEVPAGAADASMGPPGGGRPAGPPRAQLLGSSELK